MTNEFGLSVHATDDEIRQYANKMNENGLPKYIVQFWDQLLKDEPDGAEVDFSASRCLSGAIVRRVFTRKGEQG